MLHREKLRNVRAHAVADQNNRHSGKMLLNKIVDQEAVVAELLPATLISKIPEMLCVFAVTAMVVSYQRKPALRGEFCESFVSQVVLAKAVKQLQNALGACFRSPDGATNDVTVGRRELKVLSQYVTQHRLNILYWNA